MTTVRILKLAGDVDLCRKLELKEELGQVERFGSNVLTILDLTDVGYADTTLVNALVRLKKHVLAALEGSSICLVAPKHLARLFHLTEVSRMFPIFDNVPAAHESALFATSMPNVAKVRFDDAPAADSRTMFASD